MVVFRKIVVEPSETIARILQPYDIRVAHKPIITLRHVLINVKDKYQPHERQGVVCRIKCTDCQATYIGETGRSLKTRLTEHKWATENRDISNHISEHHRLTKHKIDWDSVEYVTYSTNYHQRLTLESWYTNSGQEPLNRCQQLPTPYKRPRMKPTNNKRIENNSNSNRTITTTFTFWRPITSRQNWPIRTKIRVINTIIWRRLFPCLWRWLPLRSNVSHQHQSF